nr:hypothetical protein [Tanacetum cinerariifolium]
MADVNLNVNAPTEQAPAMAPPTRTDDQILPRRRWVLVGKSNCYLDVEKSQSNPFYKIVVDILDTVRYIYQLDEQWFDLTKDTLRDALQITPVNNNNPFSSPPTPDALINFFNNLGYPKVVRTLSAIVGCGKNSPNLSIPSSKTKRIWHCTQGKKKANPIVIPSISSKGTKWEVFRMPIPNELITADIRGEQYYKEYLEKVAKHQRYLAGEKGSDPDSHSPKPAKATNKSKPSAPKAEPVTKPAAAKASESTSSQQPKPKPAPAKTQEKKRKLVTETSDEPSPAKSSKPDLVTKRRKPTSSLRLVDEFVDEGIPKREPRFDDEEADMKRAVEESLKSVHDEHQGPLLSVVFREPDSRKFQPLSEIQGKGKEKRHTPTPTEPSGHAKSPSIYAKLGFTDSDKESNEEVPPVVKIRAQDEGQAGPKPENEKTTAETEAELTVSVIIQKDTSAIPPMETPIIDLTSRPDSPNVHQPLQATATETATTTHPPPPQPQQSTTYSILIKRIVDEIVTDVVDWAIQAPLQNHFRDLPEADMKEILYQRMWETNSYKAHEDYMIMKKEEKRYDSPKTPPGSPPHQPPPPLPPADPSITSRSPRASGSTQLPPPPPLSTSQSDQSKSTTALSSSKTAASAEYIAWMTTDTRLRPSVSSIPEDLHMDDDTAPNEQVHSSDDEDIGNAHIPKVNLQQDWWKPLEEDRPATPEPAWYNVSKPIPLGGPPGQVIIQSNFFFNKDLEYLRYGSKGGRPVLSISKMEAAYYPDVGLEQMVPDQMWIKEQCKYDIAALYGISHWWFQRQRFYINRHTSEGDRRAVQTYMRILSVVRIEVFSMFGQCVEDFQLGIESYQTQLNLTKPRWDTIGFEYKHDFTIDEALDYRVKEFKVNKMNPGLNTRFWTRKDVDRSKEFMFSIQKWLKTRRIFRNLESFVGGRSAPASDHLNQNALLSQEIIQKISLGHYSIMLALSYTVKSKTDIKSPTYYPRGITRTSE